MLLKMGTKKGTDVYTTSYALHLQACNMISALYNLVQMPGICSLHSSPSMFFNPGLEVF